MTIVNIISDVGVAAADSATSGVTGRSNMAACQYGGDKAIVSYGQGPVGTPDSCTNLISNAGAVGADVTQVGSDRSTLAATQYGQDKGIMGFGQASTPSQVNICNLVSNVGVVATDTSGVGTARKYLPACSFN